MSLLTNIPFHDSSIVHFEYANATLRMRIEDLYVWDEKQDNVELTFDNIHSIMIDRQPAERMEALGDWGDFDAIEISEHRAELLIQWVLTPGKVHIYKHYMFEFGSFALSRYKENS